VQPVVVLAKAERGKVEMTRRLTVLVVGMAVAALTAALAGSVTPVRGAPVLPEGFTQSQVVSGLTNPTDMEFAPDGRLFVTEDAGRVRIVKSDGTLATFLDISTKVDSKGERGLLALTFDPGFATNHYVYLHYTRKATSTTPLTTASCASPPTATRPSRAARSSSSGWATKALRTSSPSTWAGR
jgi:glucose/arabinose dehydrogenase